ncbi:MAG: sigma 54-interacting transcriptional regulator [Hyphomicrobiaceae bacterium]
MNVQQRPTDADGRDIWERAFDSLQTVALVLEGQTNRIVHFNERALKALGLSGYELASMRASDLFPGQLPELIVLTQECQHAGHAWSGRLRLLAGDGKDRPVELYLSRFVMGERELFLAICLDLRTIRARRAALEFNQYYRSRQPEQERIDSVFRQLERGNQLILHAAGEGIYGVDSEGSTTFLNPAAEGMLGWTAEELIGRNAHSYFHHSHADGTGYPIKACPIYAAFRDGHVHRVVNEVFWRKDGSSFPVEYTSTPIEEKGRLLGAVVVFRDVSEQRQSQQDLLEALREVEALRKRLEQENEYLQYELRGGTDHKEIVGRSASVHSILKQIEQVAATDANVLIAGESGTGKELIARAIHAASPRSKRPLIRVNCASIPRDLFESEFFGHAKGAFTGAVSERVGRFELADGGTIFLDEVGELPLEHQSKLLRILQEKQFERVGEAKTRQVDVRVIAATNRDLGAEVENKTFREDLYFRLNVFPIISPPLRERLDDIPEVATHLLLRACQRANRPPMQLSVADVERLKAYHWPGNIRELENVLERAVITTTDGRLRFHIPNNVNIDREVSGKHASRMTTALPAQSDLDLPSLNEPSASGSSGLLTDPELKRRERTAIETALKMCGGRVAGPHGAARLLGLKPSTLFSRLRRAGIDAQKFKDC